LISHISVVIIAKNAQETIKECLDSLKDFDEVILYLNDSSDRTEDIARCYENVKIIKGKFEGFGPTKNRAAEHAKNNWILSLDSDEILNNNLVSEIANIDLTDIKKLYVLKRDNYFLGANTIDKDLIVRLYNNTFTSFDNALVHEKIKVPKNAEKIRLKHSFKHLNITNINQTLTKMIKYTDLGAEGQKTCLFITVIAKATFAFIQTYFLRLYILDGWRGFVIAINNANRRFYKYVKQYINCK
jgi:glycosyltransferase involved in cell wall biosynthesis